MLTVMVLLCLNLAITIACFVAIMAIYFQMDEPPPEGEKIPGPDRVVHIKKKSPKFHDDGWEINREHDKMSKTTQSELKWKQQN